MIISDEKLFETEIVIFGIEYDKVSEYVYDGNENCEEFITLRN